MYRILIAEDDEAISSSLKNTLNGWGYEAATITDFSALMDEFHAFKPDLIIMDLYLPGKNGFYWTEQIRRDSSVPILFLSSADENMNIVTALSQGADDYVTKPFDLGVLVTKIQALLRRSYTYGASSNFLEHKGVRLELDSNEVSYKNHSLELTRNEARILKELLLNKGKIVSRETLMNALWSTDCYIDENTLSVNVNRLRKKLEQIDLHDFIVTRKGSGYMI